MDVYLSGTAIALLRAGSGSSALTTQHRLRLKSRRFRSLKSIRNRRNEDETEKTPLVESENGNVSRTLSEKQIQEVPNSGNDITFNAQLAAGSVANTAVGGLGNFSSFGISATADLFTLNGMDDNDPFLSLNNSGATNLTLGNNEIQEVSVTTNGYSGEYGTLGIGFDFLLR